MGANPTVAKPVNAKIQPQETVGFYMRVFSKKFSAKVMEADNISPAPIGGKGYKKGIFIGCSSR